MSHGTQIRLTELNKSYCKKITTHKNHKGIILQIWKTAQKQRIFLSKISCKVVSSILCLSSSNQYTKYDLT